MLADKANNNGDTPVLSRVDLILGEITGPTKDRDSFAAPAAVVKSFDIKQKGGEVTLTYVQRNAATSATAKDVLREYGAASPKVKEGNTHTVVKSGLRLFEGRNNFNPLNGTTT